MKDHLKILFILLAGITLSASPYLPANPVAAAFGADVRKKAGGAESSLQLQTGGAGGSIQQLNIDTTRRYVASQLTTTGAFTLTRIDVELQRNNANTGDINCYLYSDSGGSPNALLATSTTTLDSSTLTASYVYYQFDFPDTVLSGSTVYHVALHHSGTPSASVFTKWNSATTGGGGVEKSIETPITWVNTSSTAHCRADFYGSP